MRVLFLTQYYPPETGAAPLRAFHFADKLARCGHRVTVVTGMPNHPSGVKPRAYRGKLASRECVGSTRILRCYLYSNPRKSFATRMANQVSFAVTAFFGALAAGPCDVVLVTSPPLFLGVTAWLTGLLKGAPFVLDIRDYWPRAAVELGQLTNARAIALAERLETFLYRRASKLVTVTPRIVRMMVERGIPPHRIVLVPNGADTERFTPESGARQRPGDGRWTALYSGTHGLIHGMGVILGAAEILRGDPRVRFLMVGDGAEKEGLVRSARERGLDNVEFAPSRQPEELARTIRESDVCIATMAPGKFGASAVPVKMFDYMACAKPVLAAVEGDARDVLEASGGGVAVAPGDARGLSDALVRLLEDEPLRLSLGKNGHDYVTREYSRAALARKMEEVLVEAVEADRSLGGGRLPFRRYLGVKYLSDACLSAALLVLASPVFAAVSLAIRMDSPGRAIFTQRRIGVHSHEFTIFKFRTMRRETPHVATDIMASADKDYTTRVGRILRRTSLDELPNLLNVLKGDMSIVGPRPALYNQHELIDLRRRNRSDLLRPGLTGWAQINGRDLITQAEKVRLDEFYARNCSVMLDVRIVLRTGAVVLRVDEVK